MSRVLKYHVAQGCSFGHLAPISRCFPPRDVSPSPNPRTGAVSPSEQRPLGLFVFSPHLTLVHRQPSQQRQACCSNRGTAVAATDLAYADPTTTGFPPLCSQCTMEFRLEIMETGCGNEYEKFRAAADAAKTAYVEAL